tara:strand:- start:113 stop:592 length:480 start_codon:yes stop_codon:yes gene_type:complete
MNYEADFQIIKNRMTAKVLKYEERLLSLDTYNKEMTMKTKNMEQGLYSIPAGVNQNCGDRQIHQIISNMKKIDQSTIWKLHKIFKKVAHTVELPTLIPPLRWISENHLFGDLEISKESYLEIKKTIIVWETYMSGTIMVLEFRDRELEENPLSFEPRPF